MNVGHVPKSRIGPYWRADFDHSGASGYVAVAQTQRGVRQMAIRKMHKLLKAGHKVFWGPCREYSIMQQTDDYDGNCAKYIEEWYEVRTPDGRMIVSNRRRRKNPGCQDNFGECEICHKKAMNTAKAYNRFHKRDLTLCRRCMTANRLANKMCGGVRQ